MKTNGIGGAKPVKTGSTIGAFINKLLGRNVASKPDGQTQVAPAKMGIQDATDKPLSSRSGKVASGKVKSTPPDIELLAPKQSKAQVAAEDLILSLSSKKVSVSDFNKH